MQKGNGVDQGHVKGKKKPFLEMRISVHVKERKKEEKEEREGKEGKIQNMLL